MRYDKNAKKLLNGWMKIEEKPLKTCRFYEKSWCKKGFGYCSACEESTIAGLINTMKGEVEAVKKLGVQMITNDVANLIDKAKIKINK